MGTAYGNYCAQRARNAKFRNRLGEDFWRVIITVMIVGAVVYLLLFFAVVIGIPIGLYFLFDRILKKKDWKFWGATILSTVLLETLFFMLYLNSSINIFS